MSSSGSTMQNIRAAIKRKLSLHDKNPNYDVEPEEVDDETTGTLHRDVDHGMSEEGDKYPHGKPGSFLNRLILHGNRKTEEELERDAAEQRKLAEAKLAAQNAQTTSTTQV